MHSLTINKITSVENLNHPQDFTINFEGGSITFNASNGPLKFWYDGDLVCIYDERDMQVFREVFIEKQIREKIGINYEWMNLADYHKCMLKLKITNTLKF